MNNYKYILVLFLALNLIKCYGQDQNLIDSLSIELAKAKHDSSKLILSLSFSPCHLEYFGGR
jgi:hypothetical protein